MAGVDLTDSFSAAGADDFDPVARNPTSQRVTVVMVTVPGAPWAEKDEERDVTGDRVTWVDPPYIVTLKASDKRAGVVHAGNKSEAEHDCWGTASPVSAQLSVQPAPIGGNGDLTGVFRADLCSHQH